MPALLPRNMGPLGFRKLPPVAQTAPILAGTLVVSGSATTHSLITTAEMPEGGSAVLWAHIPNGSNMTNVDDASGAGNNSYTLGTSATVVSLYTARSARCAPLRKTVPLGATITITTGSTGGTSSAMFVLVYFPSGTLADQTPTPATGTSTTPSTGNYTVTSQPQYMLSEVFTLGNVTITPAGGWTSLAALISANNGTNPKLNVYYKLKTDLAAESFDATLSGSTSWTCGALTIVTNTTTP